MVQIAYLTVIIGILTSSEKPTANVILLARGAFLVHDNAMAASLTDLSCVIETSARHNADNVGEVR